MTLFTAATNTQAKLKAGFLGFAGAGKTYTGTVLMIGLIKMLRELKLDGADRPLYFVDTETGSDWIAPLVAREGIELRTLKSRAFSDLVPAVREAEANGVGLIIDSISHFWKEFMESYMKKKNRARLEFSDWNWLKPQWGTFTDAFVNSNLHIVMCGRAGWEWDYFTDDEGKKNLAKTGIKMKAESEMGYEPSLLVLMERSTDPKTFIVAHEANVLKDRGITLDGKTIMNPTFEDFRSHIDSLNLRGTQLGVDLSRTSEDMIGAGGQPDKPTWKYEQEQKEIVLEQIQAAFTMHGLSTQSAAGKREIYQLLKTHFGTVSWKELEGFSLAGMVAGKASLDVYFSTADEIKADPAI